MRTDRQYEAIRLFEIFLIHLKPVPNSQKWATYLKPLFILRITQYQSIYVGEINSWLIFQSGLISSIYKCLNNKILDSEVTKVVDQQGARLTDDIIKDAHINCCSYSKCAVKRTAFQARSINS